jgi:hypothetical protein
VACSSFLDVKEHESHRVSRPRSGTPSRLPPATSPDQDPLCRRRVELPRGLIFLDGHTKLANPKRLNFCVSEKRAHLCCWSFSITGKMRWLLDHVFKCILAFY